MKEEESEPKKNKMTPEQMAAAKKRIVAFQTVQPEDAKGISAMVSEIAKSYPDMLKHATKPSNLGDALKSYAESMAGVEEGYRKAKNALEIAKADGDLNATQAALKEEELLRLTCGVTMAVMLANMRACFRGRTIHVGTEAASAIENAMKAAGEAGLSMADLKIRAKAEPVNDDPEVGYKIDINAFVLTDEKGKDDILRNMKEQGIEEIEVRTVNPNEAGNPFKREEIIPEEIPTDEKHKSFAADVMEEMGKLNEEEDDEEGDHE